jgi:hypothetical protein
MLSLQIRPQDVAVKSGKTRTLELDVDSTRHADVQVVPQATVKGKKAWYAPEGNAQTMLSVHP